MQENNCTPNIAELVENGDRLSNMSDVEVSITFRENKLKTIK